MKLTKQILSIATTICENGFEVYIAGGAVRDMLSGITPSDIDLLTNARPRQLQDLFKGQRVILAGKAFYISLINHIEVATFRGGHTVKNGQATAGNLHEDLELRDLTINSMALCPFTGDLVDFFNGRQDLNDGIIKFTQDPAERIKEDPCRIIRACRFLATTEGKFDKESFDAMCRYNTLVPEQTAPERIRLEIIKAMKCRKPSIFFNALQATGLLVHILPSLARCYDLDGGPFHGETVFEHCMLVGDAISVKHPLLRLAGYLHDTGKADAAGIKNGRLSFAGHEKFTIPVMKDLKKLKFSTAEMGFIENMIGVHMRPLTPDSTPKAVRRLIFTLNQKEISIDDFIRMRIADRRGNRAKKPYTLSQIRVKRQKIQDELNPETNRAFSVKELALSGDDVMKILGIKKGPGVGKELGRLLDLVIDNPRLNTEEGLTDLLHSSRQET